MEYQEYLRLTHQANDLVSRRDYAQASHVLQQLIRSDISDIDKSVMAYNLAVVAEKQHDLETAVYWYDQGIQYETPLCRFMVTLNKAKFMQKYGKTKESRTLYEKLLTQPYLTELEKEQIRQTLAT